MTLAAILLVAALTFGVCFLFDKGYTNLFRSKVQHRTGLAVRVSKRYAAFGLLLSVLGIAAVFNGFSGNMVLLAGGFIVLAMAAMLITYYMSFGVFYDADSFILTTFGKKSTVYQFRDIQSQKLYMIQGGNIVIELHMRDGRAVSLQSTMEGTFPFLDHAFSAWCRQTGRKPEDCAFHDPANSLWFPAAEET